ncbi:hypothetical protein I3760_07G174500 [Carya illinoinensis]|nr:hypothetical protein I3760_07G174500 [Carya illinoinensis]
MGRKSNVFPWSLIFLVVGLFSHALVEASKEGRFWSGTETYGLGNGLRSRHDSGSSPGSTDGGFGNGGSGYGLGIGSSDGGSGNGNVVGQGGGYGSGGGEGGGGFGFGSGGGNGGGSGFGSGSWDGGGSYVNPPGTN